MVRAPTAGFQAPGSAHTLPDSDPFYLLPELEFAKTIMKIAEAGKVSIHQQVAISNPPPPPEPKPSRTPVSPRPPNP